MKLSLCDRLGSNYDNRETRSIGFIIVTMILTELAQMLLQAVTCSSSILMRDYQNDGTCNPAI